MGYLLLFGEGYPVCFHIFGEEVAPIGCCGGSHCGAGDFGALLGGSVDETLDDFGDFAYHIVLFGVGTLYHSHAGIGECDAAVREHPLSEAG